MKYWSDSAGTQGREFIHSLDRLWRVQAEVLANILSLKWLNMTLLYTGSKFVQRELDLFHLILQVTLERKCSMLGFLHMLLQHGCYLTLISMNLIRPFKTPAWRVGSDSPPCFPLSVDSSLLPQVSVRTVVHVLSLQHYCIRVLSHRSLMLHRYSCAFPTSCFTLRVRDSVLCWVLAWILFHLKFYIAIIIAGLMSAWVNFYIYINIFHIYLLKLPILLLSKQFSCKSLPCFACSDLSWLRV